jgi:hypothetical protein
MHFLQRSTHFSKTCCRPLVTSKFLASELPFHGARSGLYGGCSNGVPPIHFFQAEHRIQFRSRSMRCLGFSNLEKGAPRQEISKWSTVCSMFLRSGWSVVEEHSFPMEVLRKRDRHRTSTKFRFGVISWVHELCKRPSYKSRHLRFNVLVTSWRGNGDTSVTTTRRAVPWDSNSILQNAKHWALCYILLLEICSISYDKEPTLNDMTFRTWLKKQ